MRGARPYSRSVAALVLWCPALLVAFNGCSAKMLPAAKVPDKTIPVLAQPADPPEKDEGQVVIDTTNGPASVQVTLFGNSAWVAPICATTPCAANLPLGTYNVVFKGRNDPNLEDNEVLQVGRAPSVLRHTIGSKKSSPGLYMGGVIGLTIGGILAFVGLLGLTSETIDNSTYTMLGLGLGMCGAGAWMMYAGRPEITPGSSVQWAPGGPAPAGPGPDAPGEKRQVLRITPTGIAVSFN